MTKIIYQVLLISFIGYIIVSCKKDSPDSNSNNTVNATEVYAGVHDASFNYSEFTPPQGISIIWDAQNLYGIGSDSLDIDSDGTHDLFISLQILNQDSLHLLTGMPNPFPSCLLNSKNGLEIAFYSESYPIGLGQTSSAIFVDRLDYNERIDLIPDWETIINMWSENPGWAGTPPFGDWYYASSVNYVALKMTGNNYGWIKIDASDPKDPKIVSYALQN
jgi:hypothetical protein